MNFFVLIKTNTQKLHNKGFSVGAGLASSVAQVFFHLFETFTMLAVQHVSLIYIDNIIILSITLNKKIRLTGI